MSYSILDVCSTLADAETFSLNKNESIREYQNFTWNYYQLKIVPDLQQAFQVYHSTHPGSNLVTHLIFASNWSEVLRVLLSLNFTDEDDPSTKEIKIRLMISISYHISAMMDKLGTDNTIRMLKRIEQVSRENIDYM